MSEHLYTQRKTSDRSASTPQHSPFQLRPFVVQPQTEEQSQQPDLKTVLDRAERYGNHLDRIKSIEPPMQRPEPRIVQAKLTIGEPGDGYEQEAEQMAQAKGEGKQPIPADPVIDMIRRSMLQRQAAISPQQKALLQAKYEQAKRFGHNLTKLAPSRPDTAQSSLQAKQISGKPEAAQQSTFAHQIFPSSLQLQPLGRGGSKPQMQHPVQPKLTIGQPGDRYEQEADRVAASVVQQINAPDPQQSTQSQSVQREATPDEEDELMKKPAISAIQRQEEPVEEIQAKPEITALQRQEEPEAEIQAKPSISDIERSPLPTQVQLEAKPEEEELQTKSILQRREGIGEGEASTDVESAINSARGGGQPLDAGLQQSMEQAMGTDFSGVKVHTDAQADKLNQSIQAKAFTTGQDVFFRSGEYNPGSRGGQELIAHELTHVVQQSGFGQGKRYTPTPAHTQTIARSSTSQSSSQGNRTPRSRRNNRSQSSQNNQSRLGEQSQSSAITNVPQQQVAADPSRPSFTVQNQDGQTRTFTMNSGFNPTDERQPKKVTATPESLPSTLKNKQSRFGYIANIAAGPDAKLNELVTTYLEGFQNTDEAPYRFRLVAGLNCFRSVTDRTKYQDFQQELDKAKLIGIQAAI